MGKKKTKKEKPNVVNPPSSLPFIEKIEEQFNTRVRRDDEKGLLRVYERNWHLSGSLCEIKKNEERYLRYLARKHHSFIVSKI